VNHRGRGGPFRRSGNAFGGRRGWTLAIAGAFVLVLGALGVNAESNLRPSSLEVSGTESARTTALLRRYFGPSEGFVILLRGPAREVDAQGRRLVRTLDCNPLASTISPWRRGFGRQLRPKPNTAVILVSFKVDLEAAISNTVPYLDTLLRNQIRAPVEAIETGHATVARAIQEEAARATRRGELIAIPLVLVALLLIFQSPIAALIPLAFGAATVVCSRGVLALASTSMPVDAFALTASTMMGLALGIDYTLLMVSRFREELAQGASPGAAAQRTKGTAGRTIAFAGCALFLSMTVSAFALPGTLLVSLAGAVAVVVVISVVLGLFVVPVLLAQLGGRINRWLIGVNPVSPVLGTRRAKGLRHPGTVALGLAVPLALLAAPAISLNLGPAGPDQLPPSNPVRLEAETVNRHLGPGWRSPYVVLASTGGGAITSRSDLAALRQWEAKLQARRDVTDVIGPGTMLGLVRPIDRFGKRFSRGKYAVDLKRLSLGLTKASSGVQGLRDGLAEATYGAGLLATGSRRIRRGSAALASQLGTASTGANTAVKALNRLAGGAKTLGNGQHRATLGARALRYDIADLIPRTRHSALRPIRGLEGNLTGIEQAVPELQGSVTNAEDQLDLALRELQSANPAPETRWYAAALTAVETARSSLSDPGSGDQPLATVSWQLGRAQRRLDLIESGVKGSLKSLEAARPLARRLLRGLTRLESGGKHLASGSAHLANSANALSSGLPLLAGGAKALSQGTGELTVGTSSLTELLGRGYEESKPLEAGVAKAAHRSGDQGQELRTQSGRLQRLTPGMFESGYLNLSALDGARPKVRSRAETGISLREGGQAARILVVPRYETSTALETTLKEESSSLERQLGGSAGVSGGRAEVNDYTHATSDRLPLVVGLVCLVTFACLTLVLRSLLVPLVAVLLNLLSVGAAFGTLALAALLPAGAPIGHWGYIDTIGAIAIFAIAFGVSIDYSVFILMRMREEFDQHGDHASAVRTGVRRTRRVVTGAALMMVAVFVAFATSELAIVGQLGVGLSVALFVDATVIRIAFLPALLLKIGPRCWWFPARLDRRLKALAV
jgi:putative drug exporter of the RND superfamily